MNISSIGNNAIQKLADKASTPRVDQKGAGEDDFAQTLMDVLKEVNTSQQDAVKVQNNFLTGRQSVDIQDVEIAMAKASTAMNLTMSVRNKVLDAYQEISRMQV